MNGTIQMEMALETPVRPAWAVRRQRRQVRARWWFEQMHRRVEQGREWATTSGSVALGWPDRAEGTRLH